MKKRLRRKARVFVKPANFWKSALLSLIAGGLIGSVAAIVHSAF